MAQVNVADLTALAALHIQRGGDGAVCRAPRDDEEIAFGVASGYHIRDVLHDGRDFRGADAHHVSWLSGS